MMASKQKLPDKSDSTFFFAGDDNLPKREGIPEEGL
jgi:hypothetical protein